MTQRDHPPTESTRTIRALRPALRRRLIAWVLSGATRKVSRHEPVCNDRFMAPPMISDVRPITSRRSWPWMADVRAAFRRGGSLRWHTKKVLKDARVVSRWSTRTLGPGAWALVGKPWVLPVLAVVISGALVASDASWSPVDIFHTFRGGSFLSTLWQVEAATVALVLAGSLFAFESLTRQRPDVALSEYASRSGLSQFFMLAASGLLAIPVVLASTPRTAAPGASLFAAVVAVGGLAALPFFFARAMKVVNPRWLHEARIVDLQSRVRAAVEADALKRVSSGILDEWAKAHDFSVGYPFGLNQRQIVEVASGTSDVLDIDLRRLSELAKGHSGQLTIFSGLGDSVLDGAVLVAVPSESVARFSRPLVTTTRGPVEDQLETLLQELHGEATDAIHRGSVRAAETVSDLYAELWLAWPRWWEEIYGQRLKGLLTRQDLFRLGPTDQLRRNLNRQLELAVDRGLRDHVRAIQGVLWSVGVRSVELGAEDVVNEMNLLARSFLTIRNSQYPELADQTVEDSWRYLAQICEYAARDMDNDSFGEDVDQAEIAFSLVSRCFSAVIESLKLFLDIGRLEEFGKLDNRLLRILGFSRWEDNRFFDEMVLEDPTSNDEQTAAAERRMKVADSIADLLQTRSAGRLSLLGWALRKPDALIEDGLIQIRNLAGTLGSVEELMAAADRALDHRHTYMSDWVGMELPEGGAHLVDADGPVLRAIAASLLERSNVNDLPGSEWMTKHRVERMLTVVDEVAGWTQLWVADGETSEGVAGRAEKLKQLLQDAEGEQRHQEDLELIDQPLDPQKVELFQDTLRASWVENRVLPEFAKLATIHVSETPTDEWGEERFGFKPSLSAKGLFVTPTNVVGLEQNAATYGRTLAWEEVGVIVRLAVEHGTEIPTTGDVLGRLQLALDRVRADGFKPTMILTANHWQLTEALGLRDDPPRPKQGPLGHSFKGTIDGVPLVQWRDIPDDRIYVIDGTRLCEVTDGVDADGESSPPSVAITPIDEERAKEIVSSWEPADGEGAAEKQIVELRTRVERRVLRTYRVDERDMGAAWFVSFDEPRKRRAKPTPPDQPPVEPTTPDMSHPFGHGLTQHDHPPTESTRTPRGLFDPTPQVRLPPPPV